MGKTQYGEIFTNFPTIRDVFKHCLYLSVFEANLFLTRISLLYPSSPAFGFCWSSAWAQFSAYFSLLGSTKHFGKSIDYVIIIHSIAPFIDSFLRLQKRKEIQTLRIPDYISGKKYKPFETKYGLKARISFETLRF